MLALFASLRSKWGSTESHPTHETSTSTRARCGGLVPKGRHSTDRGEALGFKARQILQPGKGETNAGSALTGLNKNGDAATQGLALGFRLTRFQR